MNEPIKPYQVTELAQEIGESLTRVHRAYENIYHSVYRGIERNLTPKDEERRIALVDARNNLIKVAKVLQQLEISLGVVYTEKGVTETQICNHCHERNTGYGHKYCNFCEGWARTHGGNLPGPAVLDAKGFRKRGAS